MQPLRVFVLPPGPNPWKVVLILEELEVPYEFEVIKFEDIKRQPFTDINPNGRSPAIIDPNTGITLWESGAIVLYLIKEYDVHYRLSYDSPKEQHLCNQWLMFQMSGQGPYFGQCTWFTYLHPEKVQSAIDRYANEIKRVFGVLETALAAASKVGSQWLVGNRMTFADLAFVPWNDITDMILGIESSQRFEGFPHLAAWHKRMVDRQSWIRSMQHRTRLMSEQGLGENGMPKDSSQKLAEYIKNPEGN